MLVATIIMALMFKIGFGFIRMFYGHDIKYWLKESENSGTWESPLFQTLNYVTAEFLPIIVLLIICFYGLSQRHQKSLIRRKSEKKQTGLGTLDRSPLFGMDEEDDDETYASNAFAPGKVLQKKNAFSIFKKFYNPKRDYSILSPKNPEPDIQHAIVSLSLFIDFRMSETDTDYNKNAFNSYLI